MKLQDSSMIKILIIILAIVFSCKKEKPTKPIKIDNVEKIQINCFRQSDSIKVVKILNRFNNEYYESSSLSDLFAENYIKEYKDFPSGLFEEALKNNAVVDFNIESISDECNTLAVYYNYIVKIVEDGEVYTSESTLIFYFIKNVDGEIKLEGLGAAG